MAGHLLALSIGPVQEFIAAARRTRDLWFGSFLLSELSKAAAKAIADKCAHEALVFPGPKTAEELEPTPEEKDPPLTVANVVVAKVPGDQQPAELVRAAREAVQARWRGFAEEARRVAPELVRNDAWDSQLGDVIEFYAAWVRLGNEAREYKAARKRLMRLLDGRKRCRDFPQPGGETGPGPRRKARLRDGEQLDVVGLTKRLAHGRRPFVSVARVAADPWLRGVALQADSDSDVAAAFKKLAEECRKLGAEVISRVDRDKFRQYGSFPFDGTAVYRDRYPDIAKESGRNPDELKPLRSALDRLIKARGRGGLGFGDPHPYMALLAADGDRMGKVIAALDAPGKHREFSQQLAGFADSAKTIVERHSGACIYAGGDDVLALLPVDQCLDCARALHEEFSELLASVTAAGSSPTLSIGLAVGHFMEPLEDLRNYAREAEEAAKHATPGTDGSGLDGERNGLAVFVHPRGGVPFGVREQWQEDGDSLEKRLKAWARLFGEGVLPNKLPYEVREMAKHYTGWSGGKDPAAAIRADLRRLLGRKDVRLSSGDEAWVQAQLARVGTAGDLGRLAAEMLVAQHIGEAVRQAEARTRISRSAGTATEVSP